MIHLLAPILLVVLTSSSIAMAQNQSAAPNTEPSSVTVQESPWGHGVSSQNKAAALALFREGNQLIEEALFRRAKEKYESALQHWEHPAIYGNLAICFIHLEKPIQAFESLEKAFLYGQGPLSNKVYAALQTHHKALRNSVSHLIVRTKHEGAQLSLDGRPLLVGPGEAMRTVLVGPHQVIAAKEGYTTYRSTTHVSRGAPTIINVVLSPLDDNFVTTRRWARWKPWALAGSGVVVAGTGLLFRSAASANVRRYESAFGRECPAGCTRDELPPEVRDLEGRADLQNTLAITAFVIGGALATSGIALAIANQPRRVRRNPSLRVTPTISSEQAGLSLSGHF